MAEGVVDTLEVIDVKQDEGKLLAQAQASIDLSFQNLFEIAAIPQSSQRIGAHAPFEFSDAAVARAQLATGRSDRAGIRWRERWAIGGCRGPVVPV